MPTQMCLPHTVNQPDKSDCNWVPRQSIGTPGEPAIWKEKIPLEGVVMLGGTEVRPLFSFTMLIAYRHPLTVRSQLKDETHSQGKHTAPLPSLHRNHNHLMFHAENSLKFLQSHSLCMGGENRKHQKTPEWWQKVNATPPAQPKS